MKMKAGCNNMISKADEQQHQQQMISLSQYKPPEGSNTIIKQRRRRRRKGRGGGGAEVRKKRKLSEEQLNFLEMNFGREHKLESARKDRLAIELGLDPSQVAVWFQNRRARWKSKQMEQDYLKLKTSHESLILDKCHLEAEVCILKDQLLEAEKEIQKLSERSEVTSEGGGQGSPSTCFSTSDMYDPFLGGFGGMEGDETLWLLSAEYYYNAMDWLNWNGL